MEISTSGEYERLSKEKKFSPEIYFDAWESLIRKNSEYTGDYSYHTYLDTVRQYNRFIKDYNTVRACFLLLSMVVDDNAIQVLSSKGFRVDAVPGKGSDERYLKSLEEAVQKSSNYNTKIESLYKQLVKMVDAGADLRPVLFEEVLSNLTDSLGYQVGRDITLAGYNAHVKVIKKRDERNRRFNKR